MLPNLIVPRSTSPEQLSFADLEDAAGDPFEQSSAAQARTQTAPVRTEPAAVPVAAVAEQASSTSAETVLALLTSRLTQLDVIPARTPAPAISLEQARDEWLRRLRTAACRSESAVTAYRIAIDDLLAWAGDRGQSVFEETTIVDYLAH
jgi:hypothetical protein